MPQVVDTPKTVQEERWHQYEEKTAPLRSVIQPQRGRTGLFAVLWSGMTALFKRLAPSYHARTEQPFELAVDHMARKQPYLYIESLSA